MNPIEKLKNYPVVATAIVATAIFTVIAGIYLRLDAEQDGVQETRISEYQARLTELEGLREKYNEESIELRELELRHVDLASELDKMTKGYSTLKSAGWEEKFCTEQISRRSLEEALSLATQRHKSELAMLKSSRDEFAAENAHLTLQLKALPDGEKTKMSDALHAFNELLSDKDKAFAVVQALEGEIEEKTSQIAELQDKLIVAQDENLMLRELIEKDNITVAAQGTLATTSVEGLVAAIKNMGNNIHCLVTLRRGITMIEGGVSGQEFANILDAARLTDYYRMCAVSTCAKNVKGPLTEKDTNDILAPITSSFRRGVAARALMARDTKLNAPPSPSDAPTPPKALTPPKAETQTERKD